MSPKLRHPSQPLGAHDAGMPAGLPTTRLFLALWPGPRTRAAIATFADAVAWPSGAARVAPAQMHLTLHYIGPVPAARVADIASRLAVPLPRFELRFGHSEAWPRGLAVLCPSERPAGLAALHAELGDALAAAGLPVESRPYRPHVTLARRAAGAAWPQAPLQLRWPVRGYSLVASRGGYRRIAEYPAG
jgi:2'-5' RNA ligase